MAESKLRTYRSKRDFGITVEPAAGDEVKPSARLRFVVQKHAARRLHYDLRLEWDGVFKSWAAPRGPSLDPRQRRLAVEVEDHPLAYGDFEGTIPKGQYGGGTVMLWDRGYWEPEGDLSVPAQLKKGNLAARFHGERMMGAWNLVRMDRDHSKRNNWLLIKARDGHEHEGDDDAFLEANGVSVASGRTMSRITQGKGPKPKPFMQDASVAADAVWASEDDIDDPPGPAAHGRKANRLPAFVAPQLCRLVPRPPPGAGWGHEIKFDGYRLELRVDAGEARLLTRKGLDWTGKFPEIAEDAGRLTDGIYDGEAVALDSERRPDFSALQAALSSRRTDGLVLFLFDALFSGGEDLRELALRDRKARLKAVIEAAPSPRLRYAEHFESAGDAVLKSACGMHLEGIVSKRLDAPYRSGRGQDWTKAKCRGGQEVVLAGWTAHRGRAFSSLIAGVYRDGALVHVGRIGTGFSRDKVQRLMPELKRVAARSSPFKAPGAPKGGPDVHWLKPELVAEIEFAGWTGDGRIRQASFKGLRDDKAAREVVAEGPAAEADVETDAARQAAADPPKAKAAPRSSPGPCVLGVTVTNPDKAYWPAHGGEAAVSKLELARYIEAIADWMLPHVTGRPCSLVRIPEGVNGPRFFQRHGAAGTSSLITLTTVAGDRKPYLQLDSREALIAAVQSGAAEFHPWNCRPGEPEVPGRLVFDLDPAPDVGFDEVVAAARELKDRLEGLGLVPFCKTTGGKGLHVVTPLQRARLDWPTAKAFTREVCARMADDSPDRFVVNMAKSKRGGRIFLDYLRNDRTSTAVAPLSPRARPGAPISMPLTWGQARAGLDPMRFTVGTAAALIGKSAAWEGYGEAERPLGEAVRRLSRSRRNAA